MREWFTSLDGVPFEAFGTNHVIMLIIYITGIILLLTTYKKIISNQLMYNAVRWILFGLLVLSEVSYQTWTAVNGIWSLAEHTPMHLCGIAGITGAIALVTHNKKLIIITFFIGFIPAFLALVTPELPYDFPHFRFWKFFVHHIAISWTGIFLVVTSNVKITFKSMLESYGYLIMYAAIIGFIINPWLDANYLYLSATPEASTPLDLLGSGIGYYINLCLLGLIVFTALYGLYKLFRRIEK
ncbi:YwaF family protein [Virgibacillus ainsalahensis]